MGSESSKSSEGSEDGDEETNRPFPLLVLNLENVSSTVSTAFHVFQEHAANSSQVARPLSVMDSCKMNSRTGYRDIWVIPDIPVET